MRPVLVFALVCLPGGCGDGLLQPSGADAGPPPPPSAVTFLDQRLAACPTAAELAAIADSNVVFDTTVLCSGRAHADPAVIPAEYQPFATYPACVQRGNESCMEPRQTCR